MTKTKRTIIAILILALALSACAPPQQVNSVSDMVDEIEQERGIIETIVTIIIIYWLLKIGIDTYNAMQQQ